jgi:hypothetical protein
MNTGTTNNPPAPGTQFFYVSYYTGEPDLLIRHVGDGQQFYQDFIVVEATGYEHALEFAHELLEAKQGGLFTIAKVMAEAEVEAVRGMMNRVKRGEVPPATMADQDNDVWVERFLEDGKDDSDQPKSP